ncbi:MAG: hypothetical protein ACYCQI_11800 [Gammaproteobacteria bacterium]
MQQNVMQEKNFLWRIVDVLYGGYSYFFSNPTIPQIKPHPPEQKKIHPIILPAPKPARPKVQDYDQGTLLVKINKYLALMKRPLISTEGYCHGLTLVWLYKMSEKEEDWFYRIIKNIIDYPLHKFKEIQDIEKFLIFIEWAQNPFKYSAEGEDLIHQHEVDRILQIEKIYPRRKPTNRIRDYTPAQLNQFFRKNLADNVMVTMISDQPNSHTVGVFLRNSQYYLYDANNLTGKAVKIPMENIEELFAKIRKCLYTTFDKPVPEDEMPLEIIITRVSRKQSLRLMTTPEKERMALHKDVLFSYMNLKIPQPDLQRIEKKPSPAP